MKDWYRKFTKNALKLNNSNMNKWVKDLKRQLINSHQTVYTDDKQCMRKWSRPYIIKKYQLKQ